MNNLNIIVFDMETGGLDVNFHEAIQIAGKAYNARSLEAYPPEEGGEFSSLMKPLYPERLQDAALAVNGKTRKELEQAPDQKLVWNQFVSWVGKYNIKGNSPFGAPIAAGKNIRDFDLPFADNLCKLHCTKKEKTVLFHRRTRLDLEDLMFLWFENERQPDNMKMDTLRGYFGLSNEGAHDALVDVRQTGELIIRFLKLHRELQQRQAKDGGKFIKFEGCCAR